MENIPYIDDAILEYLDTLYPDRAPDLKMSDREVWMRAGAVDVVRTLKRIRTEQEDEAFS